MSQADEFRQYAKEAMRWARQSKSETEKEALINLARTWAQAAFHSYTRINGTAVGPTH
jgi:hypothetical protein